LAVVRLVDVVCMNSSVVELRLAAIRSLCCDDDDDDDDILELELGLVIGRWMVMSGYG